MAANNSASPVTRIDLPVRIEFLENLSTLEAAKAYTLQLLEWSEKQNFEEQEQGMQGSSTSGNDMRAWLQQLNPEEKLRQPMAVYEEAMLDAGRFTNIMKLELYWMMQKEENQAKGYVAGVIDNPEKQNVVECDAFLFDDIEKSLKDKGIDSDVQCKDCESYNCEEIDSEIDATTAVSSLVKVFTLLSEKFTGGNVLVIGSGIGSFVYGACLFSEFKIIFSFEWNEKFTKLQQQIIEKHGMTDRVKIENACIPQDSGVVKAANLVIISNRFHFLPERKQCDLWLSLKCNLMKGAMILTTKDMILKDKFTLNGKARKEMDFWIQHEPEFRLIHRNNKCDNEVMYYFYSVM